MSKYTGIRMRATLVAHDERDRILLVRQGLPNESYWVLPGGKVEFGETVEEALEREIREELGVEVEVGELLAIGELIDGERHVVDFFLAGRVANSEGLKVRHEEGIAEMEWVESGEVRSRRFLPPEVIPVLEKSLENGKKAPANLGRYIPQARQRRI